MGSRQPGAGGGVQQAGLGGVDALWMQVRCCVHVQLICTRTGDRQYSSAMGVVESTGFQQDWIRVLGVVTIAWSFLPHPIAVAVPL